MGNRFLIMPFAFTLTMCSSTKEYQVQDFQNNFQKVYYERWVSGQEMGGSGINFYVELHKPMANNSKLEKVYFLNKEAQFKAVDALHYIAVLKEKETDIIMHESPEKEFGNTVPALDLKLDKNQAKIFVIKNNRKYSFILDNIKEMQMIAYPSKNKSRN